VKVLKAPGAATVMAIAAHPDDIESWCAGTLVQAIDEGAIVRLLLVTSGEHGSSDEMAEAQVVAAQREAEARTAAQRLGIAEVTFLHYPDGEVENRRELRRDLVAWIRRWQPEVVFTHDPERPWPPYLTHRDHREVGRAALDAIYPLARDHLAFPELDLQPHHVREVWLFSSSAADSFVDISKGFERKIAARLAHKSQTVDAAALPISWRERAASIGQPAGLALAEAFIVLHV